MTTGWYVYRGVDPHHVEYMDRQGAAVGAPDRHFFATQIKAAQAATRFGWGSYEIAESLVLRQVSGDENSPWR
jgi:hypothetical protein